MRAEMIIIDAMTNATTLIHQIPLPPVPVIVFPLLPADGNASCLLTPLTPHSLPPPAFPSFSHLYQKLQNGFQPVHTLSHLSPAIIFP
jgi:hypothetical protein